MANYEVNNAKQVVYAKVECLTAKQLKAVHNYLLLGYKLADKPKANKKLTQKEITAYLEQYGTPEQIKKFNEKMNEAMRDRETGEPILKKDGTPRKVGFIAGLKYFQSEFPNYPEAPEAKEPATEE